MTVGQGPPLNALGATPHLSMANDKVLNEMAFSIRKRFTVIKSSSLDVIFDCTGFVGRKIIVLPLSFDALAGPILVDIYSGATANNDGTFIPIANRDFTSSRAPQTIARLSPTGVDVTGLIPLEYLIPSSAVGVNATGAASGESLFVNLDCSKKILMRLTNQDATTDAIIGTKLDFFEVI